MMMKLRGARFTLVELLVRWGWGWLSRAFTLYYTIVLFR